MSAVRKTLMLFVLLLPMSVATVSAQGFGSVKVYRTFDAACEAAGIDFQAYSANPMPLTGLTVEDSLVTLEDHGFAGVNSWFASFTLSDGVWTYESDEELYLENIRLVGETNELGHHAETNYFLEEDVATLEALVVYVSDTEYYGFEVIDDGLLLFCTYDDDDGNTLEVSYDEQGNMDGLFIVSAARQSFQYEADGRLMSYYGNGYRWNADNGWMMRNPDNGWETSEAPEGFDLDAYMQLEIVSE